MKIAFMPDTHFGEYDQVEPPTPDQVADAMEHCIAEAELAEKVGFDGIWVPERHQRPETWWPNTVSMLMALAARTKRVQLACTVIQRSGLRARTPRRWHSCTTWPKEGDTPLSALSRGT